LSEWREGPATRLVVRALRLEARDVISCELARPDRQPLPAPEPGAHVDLHLPGGLVRQYSLVDWGERHYTVAIQREANSRGGSRFLCDTLRVGDELLVGAPRNAFALDEGEHPSVLVAGGIGITPVLPMARRLAALGRDWALYVAARSEEQTPFVDELRALGARVRFSFEQPVPGRFDLAEIVRRHGEHAHCYACGSARLLDGFLAATAHLPPARVHIERFTAVQPEAGDGGIAVTLARSGRCVQVAADQTILDALMAAGIAMPHSCQQGICGQCEVRVIAGEPEHRDSVLSEAERASNQTVMVCCSRARSGALTLDL